MHTSISGPFPLDAWNVLFLRKSLKGTHWNKKKLPTTPSPPRKIQPRTSTTEWSETITHDACGEILAGNSDKQLLLAVTQLARCKCISVHKVLCTLIDRQRLPAWRTYYYWEYDWWLEETWQLYRNFGIIDVSRLVI